LLIQITKTLKLAQTEVQSDVSLDTLSDLEFIYSSTLSTLDPYLKTQIQKRGVTCIQNLYTGFDTEYELRNPLKFLNKLVSVQVAIQTRTLIKIPLYNLQNISYIHPLTSEITPWYKPRNVS
jgi:hypothetical protein